MLLVPSKSKQNGIFPTPRKDLQKKREQLIQYHSKFIPKHTRQPTQHSIASAPHNATRELLSSSLESRLKSSRQTAATLTDTSRPLTSTSTHNRCHHRSSSPLSIIKTQSKSLQSSAQLLPHPLPLQTNFLRKGTSVDRTIIRNILMSKLTNTVCRPTQSYSDVIQNKSVLQVMANQIPVGIRDIVGAQEMMRMSHVVMGVQFRTEGLRERVDRALEERRRVGKRNATQEEEVHTLKSNQRW